MTLGCLHPQKHLIGKCCHHCVTEELLVNVALELCSRAVFLKVWSDCINFNF